MLFRKEIKCHSRIESEDLKLWIIGAHVAPFHSCVTVAYSVILFENLDYLAATSPAIRRQILFPKLITRWQGYSVELGVFGPDPLIPGRAILQVEVVPVFLKVFPLHSHL